MSHGPPPNDLDAEAALIKELFMDEQALKFVRPFLRPEHFYSESHRRIYEGILAVAGDGVGDKCIVRVGTWLKDRGRIAQVGGMGYLIQILNEMESKPGNVQVYGEIVYDKWRVREAIKAAQELQAYAYTDYGETQSFLESSADKLSRIARAAIGGPAESNSAKLKKAIAELGGIGSGRAQGLLTGIRCFDEYTHGLRPKTKNTWAALTGVGKSVAALQASVTIARGSVGVIYFTTEMPAHEMIFRTISHLSGVWVPDVIQYGVPKGKNDEFVSACADIGKLPIHFDDCTEMTPEYIRSTSELWIDRMRQQRGVPLGLVVVDYVQRLEPSREMQKRSTYDQHVYATRMMKNIAKDLSIPVLELAQEKTPTLIRDKSGKGSMPEPTELDTADCKVIGKEADTLTFFRRIGDGSDRSAIMMHLVKQRNGPAGKKRRIEFNLKRGYFETIDDDPEIVRAA